MHPRDQTPDFPKLLQLLKAINLSVNDKSFIIFDALDECDKAQTDRICVLIKTLRECKSLVKIFATSRPVLGPLQDQFLAGPTIELQAHRSDLGNYIASKLEERRVTNLQLCDMIMDKLLGNAGGL